jgi:hypothetical protein
MIPIVNTTEPLKSNYYAEFMFRNHFPNARLYRQATAAKISKKDYLWEIELTHNHGKVEIARSLLERHLENPYKSVDELIGDIQILLVESKNNVWRLMPNHTDPAHLDKLIKDTEAMVNLHESERNPQQ